ncbi:MAG: hypothetical protein Ct9H300mP11_16520 [Chloroflexota bacterium]|nr:MAG: hypothetical protein Ct9H300mP11_16520 [Chloroflexota bacterium]
MHPEKSFGARQNTHYAVRKHRPDIRKIARDTDRDYYLTAEQAVEYSLVDEILGAENAEDS